MDLNAFINRYFGIILFTAACLGLFIPLPEIDTTPVIIISLAAVIFASFFGVELNKKLFLEQLDSVMIYFVVRFVALPVLLFYLLLPFSEFYAAAFLLLTLLPAAVSSPAFTSIYGGSLPLSLKILVFTSFLAIASIPLVCKWTLSGVVEIDGGHMFRTMVYTIVVPFLLHLPLRKSGRVRREIFRNTPLITAIGLGVIFIISTARNRGIILDNKAQMLIYAAISVAGYLFLYLIGLYMMFRQPKANRIAWSIGSGANNIGLGVTLTALFFSGEMNVFFIISQLAWIFMLIPLKRLF